MRRREGVGMREDKGEGVWQAACEVYRLVG